MLQEYHGNHGTDGRSVRAIYLKQGDLEGVIIYYKLFIFICLQ
jgi:hypothetical protein